MSDQNYLELQEKPVQFTNLPLEEVKEEENQFEEREQNENQEGMEDIEEVMKEYLEDEEQQKESAKSNRLRIVERLVKNKKKFEEQEIQFNLLNTISLAITLYTLISIINIEGQESLKLYDETVFLKNENWRKQGFTLYYLIILLILVHMVKIFNCILGFFCVIQKSERFITIYMMFTTLSVITRGIVTILLLIDFNQIQKVCQQVFGEANNVATMMALQFFFLLLIFMSIELILGMKSLLLAGNAKKRYKKMRADEKKVASNYQVSYNVMIKQFQS